MWIRLALLHTIVAATALAACDLSKAGNLDKLKFTPTDCGAPLLGCSFAYPLAVGAVMNVQIMSTDPLPAGLDLQSDKPTVFTVTSLGNISGVPTWQLRGVAPGDADLNANASPDPVNPELVDMINVQVAKATQLGLVGSVGVPQPAPSPGSAMWTVVVDTQASFQVVPFAIPMQTMHLTQLTGRLPYALTPVLPSGLGVQLPSTEDLRNGVFIVKPTVIGSYPLSFYHVVGDSNFNVQAIVNVVSMSR